MLEIAGSTACFCSPQPFAHGAAGSTGRAWEAQGSPRHAQGYIHAPLNTWLPGDPSSPEEALEFPPWDLMSVLGTEADLEKCLKGSLGMPTGATGKLGTFETVRHQEPNPSLPPLEQNRNSTPFALMSVSGVML